MRPLPRYAAAGLAIMAVSEAGMLLQIEPFWSWHTPIVWTGYILLVDGLVWRRRGDSWLASARPEFIFLAIVSIPLWLIFEFFNLFIENWRYINLPEHPFWRTLGYAWSFATIWPAIFETGELVACYRRAGSGFPSDGDRRSRGPEVTRPGLPLGFSPTSLLCMGTGAVMLAWPILWPSPYLAAPVWLGFIFLLDPLNARVGAEALVTDYAQGRWDRSINLVLAGLVCGILWEFWNYWSRTKWIYTVPIMPIMADARLFEMPLPGYIGFPAFAFECFTMYVMARALMWRRPSRPIAL